MVRKFVFVPGVEPHLSPVRVERTASGGKVIQWVLLGAALAVSGLAFAAAKASFERQPEHAAVHR